MYACLTTPVQPYTIDPDRPRDVLELVLSSIVHSDIELGLHLVMYNAAETNPAGLGNRFQTRRNIHPISKNVSALDNNIANVYTDTKLYALALEDVSVAHNHRALDFNGTAHRINHTLKHGQ